MSNAWFVSPSGELMVIGPVSDLRMSLDDGLRESPLIRRTEFDFELKLTAEQWRTWATWMVRERRYQRLRQQHKAKGRGKKWRHVA